MPKTYPGNDSAAARTLVLAVAALTLAVSAFVAWRLLGASPTDSFSEIYSYYDALSIAAGQHKFGIVVETHVPGGSTYTIVPLVKRGIRDLNVLRRVPFAFGLLCEGLLLAVIAAMRVSPARRLWMILAMGTIFLQPGVAGWLGALHENSYLMSCSFALLAAAAGLRRRFRPAAFALTFLTGWFGYDYFMAQFCGVLALRWLIHCRDASDGDLAVPFRETVLDAISVGSGMGLAVFTHFLQNAAYFGSVTAAFKDIIGAAAARMAIQSGAKLNPDYYKTVANATLMRGNPPRIEIIHRHLAAFFSAGWSYPSQIALLGTGILLTTASSLRMPRTANTISHLGVFCACVLFCFSGWILVMPSQAVHHLHLFPRHFFVGLTVMTLASVMLPDAFLRSETARALREGR